MLGDNYLQLTRFKLISSCSTHNKILSLTACYVFKYITEMGKKMDSPCASDRTQGQVSDHAHRDQRYWYYQGF